MEIILPALAAPGLVLNAHERDRSRLASNWVWLLWISTLRHGIMVTPPHLCHISPLVFDLTPSSV
jgi:hypothetical protein